MLENNDKNTQTECYTMARELGEHILEAKSTMEENDYFVFVNQVTDILRATITGDFTSGCSCAGCSHSREGN